MGYLRYETYNTINNGKKLWDHIGYASDIENGQRPYWLKNLTSVDSVQSLFNSDGVENYALRTSVDLAGNGWAGGPLFAYVRDSDPTQLIVTGIMVAISNERLNVACGGPGMVNKIDEIRAQINETPMDATTTSTKATSGSWWPFN